MKLTEGRPEDVGLRPDRIELVRRRLASWVEEGYSPSIIALVARRGRIVLHEAFGVLGPGVDSPAFRSDSIFPVSSITKPITATSVMMLVEDGRLGLNRPLVEYIPEVRGRGTEEICVHHLLTHTSGYNADEINELTAKRMEEGYEPDEVEPTQDPIVQIHLDIGYEASLWKPPGEEMNYCNYNYLLLGEIVRRISGQPLETFSQERIFGPLGMRDSWYSVPEAVRSRIVRFPEDSAYTRFLAPLHANSRGLEEIPWAPGGVFSTVRDLAVFGQTFLNRGRYGDARILGPRTVAAMTRNHIPGIAARRGNEIHKEASYGLGWSVQSNEKWTYDASPLLHVGAYQHSGIGASSLMVDPFDELVMVYFEVTMKLTEDLWFVHNTEKFQNVICSAIED